jgi:hypothetical protein
MRVAAVNVETVVVAVVVAEVIIQQLILLWRDTYRIAAWRFNIRLWGYAIIIHGTAYLGRSG